MITININIPQWKDFTKWFWDKFCFPRRKVVAEYFEWYNDEVITDLDHYLYKALDCEHDENRLATLLDLELHLKEIMGKETDKIKSVMYKLK